MELRDGFDSLINNELVKTHHRMKFIQEEQMLITVRV